MQVLEIFKTQYLQKVELFGDVIAWISYKLKMFDNNLEEKNKSL